MLHTNKIHYFVHNIGAEPRKEGEPLQYNDITLLKIVNLIFDPKFFL
jgi:hypothetical protein